MLRVISFFLGFTLGLLIIWIFVRGKRRRYRPKEAEKQMHYSLRFNLWKFRGKDMKFIRFCHTCSKESHKLVEVGWFESLRHRFRGHWVRAGYIRREEVNQN